MWALWIMQAAASTSCEAPIADYLDQLRQHHARQAYVCLVERDDAHDPLMDAATSQSAEDDGANSVTRALGLHLAQRLGRLLTGAEVRALNPDDRRLLRDAVRARRGRRSPAEEHDKVFSEFDWYQPDPAYTDKRLDDTDRANLALLDNPPPPPADPETGPAPAAEAMAEAKGEAPPGCGCAHGGGGLTGLWLLGLLGLVARRR